MEILAALKQEQGKLQHQLKAIETAITALNGMNNSYNAQTHAGAVSPNVGQKRTMSAAAKARISKAMKARWAKARAEKARKAK